MAYATVDQWAIKQNYASFAAYTTDNATGFKEGFIEETLAECADIINYNIGSLNSDITDSTYTSYLKRLNIRMANRMLGIDITQGKGNFTPYSLADFLQERERRYIRNEIGVQLGYRVGAYVD